MPALDRSVRARVDAPDQDRNAAVRRFQRSLHDYIALAFRESVELTDGTEDPQAIDAGVEHEAHQPS
jgi:hypothetical protein